MKTVFTLLALVLIIAICAVSGALYLNAEYTTSALLTITWIVSITFWIKSTKILDRSELSK